MNITEIFEKWNLRQNNKQASLDMWNSMAQSFGGQELPSFENNNFLQLLDKNRMFDSSARILDVGCGTGSYSLALAERCREVVGVDLSPNMIRIAKERAAAKKIMNAGFRCLDWHEVDLSQTGFEKSFGLVIARNTPAIQSAETFQKLSRASRGWCVMSKPTRRSDPVSDEVKKLIGLSEKRESSDMDILYAFELLWLQGLLPRFEYERQSWNMKKTPDEAYGLYINRVKTYRDISMEEEEKIKVYLRSIQRDGLVCEDVDTTVTTIYWHV